LSFIDPVSAPSYEDATDRARIERPALVPAQAREPKTWIALRIAVAVPLLALSIGALFPFAIIPVSSQAVVNARLSQVRAPAGGTLKNISLEAGDIVRADDPIAEIVTSPAASAAADGDYERSLDDLTTRSASLAGQISASQRKLSKYSSDATSYTSHLAGDLRIQLQAATANRDASQSALAPLEEEVRRDQQAFNDHLMPRTMLDQASQKLDEAKKTLQAAADEVSRLQRQIHDVDSGYLLDGSSQAPVSIEQRDEAASEADQLRQQKEAVDEQLARLKLEHSEREAGPTGDVVLKSPVSGPVWARSASPSQAVAPGEDLFRVADAASIHVEVWLDRRYGPQLSIGDVALIYLSGLGKQLTGRVVAFQGTSRRRLDEEVNAIDLQPVHPDQYHVTIELAPADRQAIYIGQAAKVLFPGSKDQLRAKFYSLLMRF
jgi:multidrug resistance efflux pump